LLFDLDHPGHHLRRITSVAVSVPCVTGPFTTLNGSLTLVGSSVRRTPQTERSAKNSYLRTGRDDSRFVDLPGAGQSIALATGREDYGMFEPATPDGRYRPFEGAGAISSWHVELDPERNPGLLDTATDVVLHLRYTARPAGEAHRRNVEDWLAARPRLATRMFSARRDFPREWEGFVHPAVAAAGHQLALPLTDRWFLAPHRGAVARVNRLELVVELADAKSVRGFETPGLEVYATSPGNPATVPGALVSIPARLGGAPCTAAPLAVSGDLSETTSTWTIGITDGAVAKLPAELRTTVTTGTATHHRLKSGLLHDVLLLVHVTLGPP
jgi:hypothetical protein